MAAVIQAPLAVNPGEVSAWIDTSALTNIIVGVSGRGYKIEYNLGGKMIYTNNISHEPGSGAVTIVKANAVRVRNPSRAPLTFEIFG